MIQFIVIGLLLLPIHWAITDLREGKIKNFFVFPSLLLLVVLTFFIEWFYASRDNLISLFIIISFAYLFYKNNRWGAWDGKYLILLGTSIIIAGYLKWAPFLILEFFVFVFSIFLGYVFIYLALHRKKIRNRIKLKRIRIDVLDTLFLSTLLFSLSFYAILFFPKPYSFLLAFISIVGVLPVVHGLVRNRYAKYLCVGVGIVVIMMNQSYLSYAIALCVYMLFQYIQEIIDQVFDVIDTKEIPVITLQQWNILTKSGSAKILKDAWISTGETPLQGIEVYNILDFYKKSWKEKEAITVYKDMKLWVILYIGYVLVLLRLL